MGQLVILILQDLAEPAGYIPEGILAGCLVLLGVNVWHWCKKTAENMEKQPRTAKRQLLLFLFAVYVTVVLQTAFFSREPGSRTGVDLGLFATWGKSWQSHAYVIENVLMFLPFGVMAPLIAAWWERPCICVAAGFCFSVCLEFMQLVTQRGHCQLDDVVMNTLGTAVGWGCRLCFLHGLPPEYHDPGNCNSGTDQFLPFKWRLIHSKQSK